MNWTIFFAIIILLFILGCMFGFCKGLLDLKNKKLDKERKVGDIHDDISNK